LLVLTGRDLELLAVTTPSSLGWLAIFQATQCYGGVADFFDLRMGFCDLQHCIAR